MRCSESFLASPRKYDAEFYEASPQVSIHSGCVCGKSGTDLGDHERLDLTSVGDMWTNAEVDHGSATVDSGGGAIGNLALDEILLVRVVLYTTLVSPAMV